MISGLVAAAVNEQGHDVPTCTVIVCDADAENPRVSVAVSVN